MAKKNNVVSINARPPKSRESLLYGEAEMRRLARSDLQKMKDSVRRTIESMFPRDVLKHLLEIDDWDEFRRLNNLK